MKFIGARTVQCQYFKTEKGTLFRRFTEDYWEKLIKDFEPTWTEQIGYDVKVLEDAFIDYTNIGDLI